MKISETCRCGGSIVVESDETYQIQKQIEIFRDNHSHCLPSKAEKEETENG